MLSLKELNVFQKYCDNQINYSKFEEMMLAIYPSTKGDGYIANLYPHFTTNPVRFITSRSETGLFVQINNRIYMEKYSG